MPFKPGERLYRSFSANNFQPVVNQESDDESTPSYKVRGYYTVWDAEYTLYDAIPSLDWPAEYEKVDRNALDNADLSDVIFQENHEGSPLARIRNGSLTLGTDEHGAWCEAYLGGCQRGRDLYESICNGLIVEMSFGFTIADDDDGRGVVTTKDERGDYHTTITRVAKIYDVSGVSIPASPYTEISDVRNRSAACAQIEAERRAAEEAAEAERKAAEEAAEEKRKAEEAEQQRLANEAKSRRMRRARAMALRTI